MQSKFSCSCAQDCFGLSTLHQLRGRVGRGLLQGYAYLTYSSQISSDALGRLHFLKEKSYLGAGFEIAQRDLELRGAGSLLGKAQKGARSSTVKVSQQEFREQVLDAECELAGQVALESSHAAVADALNATAATSAMQCDDTTPSPRTTSPRTASDDALSDNASNSASSSTPSEDEASSASSSKPSEDEASSKEETPWAARAVLCVEVTTAVNL